MNEDDKSSEQTDAPAPAEDGLHTQDAPADALSRTPDDLEEEQAAAKVEPEATDGTKPKKVSKLKLFFKRINVYLLIFILVVIVAIAVTIVFYLNSQKPPVEPTVASQELTEEALRGLANKDASVGGASQTLTIQGNAIIDGQTLMRGNLNIAGNLQTGGSIQGPTLTISGSANLGDAQINSLQVATNTAIQGNTAPPLWRTGLPSTGPRSGPSLTDGDFQVISTACSRAAAQGKPTRHKNLPTTTKRSLGRMRAPPNALNEPPTPITASKAP